MKKSHHNNTFTAGFTLVEMLIVIAIVAILASVALVSVRGVRESASDTKRISDLSKVQTFLEIYYNKTGKYPNETTWDGLQTELQAQNIVATNIPQDPLGVTRSYAYGVQPGTFQRYVLRAQLLDPAHKNLTDANEIDTTEYGVVCNDTNDGYYCISSF
ncbi:hypothetical protein A2333_00165 [Candidatus Wolfebacteria bacterium RIFOXYB2_FULL_49_7]|uniref:Type II secretion system protein GspG C-terminal domain-containing protein n=1 Tax=Candidatus Wolfebacteria bacterium RIFOXYB1_FULL_54_12 TaxID=1802559 RepID=A0A1F8DXI1_9BACT|nr:MAG: hypothetical protein A2372_02290 [Candidatus Wolfebacteria bacterium RIFOXYB1_FULL_54_12]OGM95671.1 MAG: hypothetical protein A2333_00165 [Candidatus Wolfebacteria bacterium RIFOXYB2_FULL_49_7]